LARVVWRNVGAWGGGGGGGGPTDSNPTT
jgi:hypothetical protein